MRLPPFRLEIAFLEEAYGDDLLQVPAIDSFPTRWAVAFAAVVVLLGCHESACQAFVAEYVTYVHG